MRLNSKILCLPASILLLISSHLNTAAADDDQSAAQWPYNLPAHVRYWPEDPPHRRRDLEAINEHVRLGRSPVGVMKMSGDEGEKFYMEYWQFEGDLEQVHMPDSSLDSPLRTADEEEDARLLANLSTPISFRAPFALHTEGELKYQGLRARGGIPAGNGAAALAVLENRGFACPGGTLNCSSIGYPNSCCGTDETCFVIQDTGLGPVGCCPTGSSCGGTITNCNAPNTPCPDSLGGGCCIPNYVCAGVGCVTSSSQTSTQSSTTVTAVLTTTTTETVTDLQTTLACASNFHACPVNLGGGCCTAGRVCASPSICLAASGSTDITTTTTLVITTSVTTGTGVAPVRPTSDSSTATSTTTSVETSCPTGFYACEAYYQGGCCRTGRNCDTTSCPVVSSTTIISSGVTVVVPVGAAATVTSPTGSCASGWFTCAPSDGGDCCPNGYQCGTVSCTSVQASATVSFQKESPSAGTASRGMRGSAAAFVGALMVALVFI